MENVNNNIIEEDKAVIEADELETQQGISEEELKELLREIYDDDNDLLDEQQNVLEETSELSDINSEETDVELLKKELEDGLLPEEKMTDGAWCEFGQFERNPDTGVYYGSIGFRLYSEMREKAKENMRLAHQRHLENIALRKQRKIEIQRKAFDQTVIDLNENIPAENLKLLISLLTASYIKMLKKYETYINRRVTMLLRPFIPKLLKRGLAKYPIAMIKHPGFMYIASKEYGSGHKMWVMPEIPYYIPQGTEMELLRKNKASFLFAIDKAVEQFYRLKEELSEKEVTYAAKLIGRKTNTYYGLLKLNPFWFNILFEELEKRHNANN